MAVREDSWKLAHKFFAQESTAVLAGGAVRDILCGVEPRDLDVYCWVPTDAFDALAKADLPWYTHSSGRGWFSGCGIGTESIPLLRDYIAYGKDSYERGFISTGCGHLNVLICNNSYFASIPHLLRSFDCTASQFAAWPASSGGRSWDVFLTKGAKLWFEERILWFKSGVSVDYVNKIVAKVPHKEVRYATAREWQELSEVV